MRVYSKLATIVCLVCLTLPAFAQDAAHKRQVDAFVNQVSQMSQKVQSALQDMDKVSGVLKHLGDGLEQTYMTATRTVYPDDFDSAANQVGPLTTTFNRLNSDMQSLTASAVKDARANQSAKELLRTVQQFERRYNGGKAVVEDGAKVKKWTDKIVNEMRLPRGRDLTLGERSDVEKVVEATKTVGKVMANLKKSAEGLVKATTPEKKNGQGQ